MGERSRRVDDAIKHAKHIRESIDDLARSKNRSVLLALGISPLSDIDESTDDSTDESDLDVETDEGVQKLS